MVLCESLFGPNVRKGGSGIPRYSMIACKYEYRILIIGLFAGSLHKFPKTKIGVAECIVLCQACKSCSPELSSWNIFKLEFTQVFFRNSKRSVIVGRLNYCKKRLRIFCQYFIRFKEQVLVAYPPNIHLGCVEIVLLKNLNTFNIVIQNSPEICPGGTSSKKIKFISTVECINNSALVNCCRVAAGS